MLIDDNFKVGNKSQTNKITTERNTLFMAISQTLQFRILYKRTSNNIIFAFL